MSDRGRFNWVYTSAAWRNHIRPRALARDGHACQIAGPRCLGEATEVDHIIPLADGGDPYDLNNLRAACQPCNGAHRGPPVGVGKPSREW